MWLSIDSAAKGNGINEKIHSIAIFKNIFYPITDYLLWRTQTRMIFFPTKSIYIKPRFHLFSLFFPNLKVKNEAGIVTYHG